ncbi:undecaprenyl-phosphate alpha-N-acetylglucosaminyl 1-phosphate transferase [Halolactibacillus alkaliphilus]|uniref:Undecaprenyl-phosphate alpha-N-acetylglucosaminyl 1-phosphate transferase n=1 Tax=Halolactibacillus alkaliphilus TaxID=442899 RepID=A0A511X499_9BACI|nr:MraY family glycosyltransferase [Halolactibacillus alkaliphilus]GEN57745.1 undecaprenyl-phosphate alpha-N-acetylglucosaminyl 1-phosphate transferase [Halolactibacillus alkaliphilus]GGN73820.1 undecaprenyl-phosphate alpha-N-acetylglucosaminyl 1-phosphate transferase [Halolactibacillus alkaliphilus]SFO98841.1 UDP-GlcNAc:undecaprenyl-phosphate GlcNAc-1-phosphate transferase [Halolactibacillus alkaliphilus]
MFYFTVVVLCFIIALVLTPLVKKLAFLIGATDQPNKRKIHQKIMPRLGGLAIIGSFIVGMVIFNPDGHYKWPMLIGALLIMAIGIIDDMYQVSARYKFFVQFIAAFIVVLNGVVMEFINLPFGYTLEFGYLSIPITVLWVVGITNAINLIDGLDGLAGGVSTIALLTISGLAIMLGDFFVATIAFMLVGATLGFLVFNFYPAKIFMGDTGALFLGYMIGVLSILGFKNATIFSLIVPIAILGVPIIDTLFAIVRRAAYKKPLYAPDKLHLHHCLLNLGFSHRQTVVLIYAMSALFSVAAILFSRSVMWGSTLLFFLVAILVELLIELTGLVGYNYRPLLNAIGRHYRK